MTPPKAVCPECVWEKEGVGWCEKHISQAELGETQPDPTEVSSGMRCEVCLHVMCRCCPRGGRHEYRVAGSAVCVKCEHDAPDDGEPTTTVTSAPKATDILKQEDAMSDDVPKTLPRADRCSEHDSADALRVERGRSRALWMLLDNIDTLDDSCRSNDAMFRDAARKQQKRRHDLLTTDGYSLFLPDADAPKPTTTVTSEARERYRPEDYDAMVDALMPVLSADGMPILAADDLRKVFEAGAAAITTAEQRGRERIADEAEQWATDHDQPGRYAPGMWDATGVGAEVEHVLTAFANHLRTKDTQ